MILMSPLIHVTGVVNVILAHTSRKIAGERFQQVHNANDAQIIPILRHQIIKYRATNQNHWTRAIGLSTQSLYSEIHLMTIGVHVKMVILRKIRKLMYARHICNALMGLVLQDWAMKLMTPNANTVELGCVLTSLQQRIDANLAMEL